MFYCFVSLGWMCSTASSMSRYGLRSASGPFDWYKSELQTVIGFIDTNFTDFLVKENLRVDRPGVFTDKKYNITFTHDLKYDFEREFDTIHARYERRIQEFRSALKKGVCLIRAVHDDTEIKWICNNNEYIETVVKRENSKNQIVFLIPYYISIPKTFQFKYYVLQISAYQGPTRYALRTLLETNREFIDWCISNIDDNVRKDNLIFDMQKELETLVNHSSGAANERILLNRIDEIFGRLQTSERYLRTMLSTMDFDRINFPPKVVIYGTDWIAKFLCNKIKDITEVVCFFDPESKESEYKRIPILKPDQCEIKDAAVIVTPVFRRETINQSLEQSCGESTRVLFFEDILKGKSSL